MINRREMLVASAMLPVAAILPKEEKHLKARVYHILYGYELGIFRYVISKGPSNTNSQKHMSFSAKLATGLQDNDLFAHTILYHSNRDDKIYQLTVSDKEKGNVVIHGTCSPFYGKYFYSEEFKASDNVSHGEPLLKYRQTFYSRYPSTDGYYTWLLKKHLGTIIEPIYLQSGENNVNG